MTTFHLMNQVKLGSLTFLMKSLFVVISLSISTFAYTQSTERDAWTLLKSQEGIEVYSMIKSCDTEGSEVPFDYLHFKVVNSSNTPIKAELKFEIYFDEGCNGCYDNKETTREINLQPGEIIESTCSYSESKLSYTILNPNFKDSWHYSHSKVFIQLINN